MANPRLGDPPAKESPAALAGANRAELEQASNGTDNRTTHRRPQDGVGIRLRELARDVRRIGGRDPEAIAISKDEVAVALVGLARRIEGGRR